MKKELREGYILTEAECIEKGGHKYEHQFHLSSMASSRRICKYCGHQQVGRLPEVIWEDTEE